MLIKKVRALRLQSIQSCVLQHQKDEKEIHKYLKKIELELLLHRPLNKKVFHRPIIYIKQRVCALLRVLKHDYLNRQIAFRCKPTFFFAYFSNEMEAEIRILLVDDEENLVDLIQLNLELEGYKVKVARDGKEALKLYKEQRFNLVILDIMLPFVDGLQVCETIRLTDKQIPILMLSAKHSGQDRIAGLKSGADDYLVKPFNLEELLLRVQILVKRSAPAGNIGLTEYSFGENYANFDTYEFKGVNNQQGILSSREMKLLKLLIEKKGEVVSRDLILEMIWGVDVYPSTRTIDNYLLNFRKYFEKDPKNPVYFHSVRGVGYKFSE